MAAAAASDTNENYCFDGIINENLFLLYDIVLPGKRLICRQLETWSAVWLDHSDLPLAWKKLYIITTIVKICL